MLSKTWKQRTYEIQKYIYVKPKVFLKKKKTENLFYKSPQSLSKFYIKEDFQMISKYIKSSQLHWSSEKSKV